MTTGKRAQRPGITLDQARAARRAPQPTEEEKEAQKQAVIDAATARAQAHPMQREIAALGKELNQLGMQWSFGNSVNTQFMDFQPVVFGNALAQILMEDYGLSVERWQDVVFANLKPAMEAARDAARQARSGLYVPPTEVPPDLFTGPSGHKKSSD